jgi:uncharacterized protein YbjT (DUF2867 family)
LAAQPKDRVRTGGNIVIYVSGAPGNVGTPLVKLLADRGQQVRVLVHKPESAQALAFPGVETVVGDLDDPASLDSSIGGAETVFLNSGVGPPILAQKNLIDAAKRAGVGRIVKLSWVGAAPDSPVSYGRMQSEAEEHLKASGVPYTILQAHAFMQNILGQAGAIAAQDAFYGSAGEGKASYVDTRDIAAVAATALMEPGHEGKVYRVTGPEALAYGDLAAIISKVTGRPISYVNLTGPQMEEGLKGFGFPDWLAADFVKTEAYQAAGGMAPVSDVVATVGKKAPTTFEAFAREFAGLFAKAS